MTLSIIIPVYNEKDTIRKVLRRVENAPLAGTQKEIIVVDDGSTDGTREVLQDLGGKYQVILQDKNEGKGTAVKAGFLQATGDILIIQDADLEYNPEDYEVMIASIAAGKADVVFGSRFIGDKPHRVLYFWHYLGNRLVTTLSNIFTNLNLSDMEAGYKAFSRRAYGLIKNEITARRFSIEPELAALAAKHHLRVYEAGISYEGRTYEEGKKINWKDGAAAIYYIIKYALLH